MALLYIYCFRKFLKIKLSLVEAIFFLSFLLLMSKILNRSKNNEITVTVEINLLFGGFPGGSDGKASACNAGDLGSIPGLGRSPGEGNGNPLQYSCLENPMDRGAW